MYKKILACVALQKYIDFTPYATLIREMVINFSRLYNSECIVFTSKGPVALMAEDIPVEEKLEKFCAELEKSEVRFKKILREGVPKDLILEIATRENVDLIIMGSHSKQSVFDVLLGGTAAGVLKDAPCKVLMVSPSKAEAAKVKELIIPEYPFVFPYF